MKKLNITGRYETLDLPFGPAPDARGHATVRGEPVYDRNLFDLMGVAA
ncbi:hypothetical protein [Cereibacter johrii]|nr:hypothetical protein [Cereibacter johrii]